MSVGGMGSFGGYDGCGASSFMLFCVQCHAKVFFKILRQHKNFYVLYLIYFMILYEVRVNATDICQSKLISK